MEQCASWQVKDPAALKGNWRSLMPQATSLRLELGCGKGRFTCQTAAAEPEVLFVAVERVPDAMVVAMEKAKAMDLHNVFFVDADAANLPEYFADGEVDRIYINFCDPWPTKRHAKRRLTHRNFLLKYRQVLGEQGEIHFKTDNSGLFEFSVLEFPQGGFQPTQVTRDLHANGIQGIMTDYEEKFHNIGTKITRCVAVKGELPPQPEEEKTAQPDGEA
jgi:tRNA (guanine-N7-)-methyltransferase